MEPVCHVEGWGGARSLVCTPHTHVHTVPTAQIHTRARSHAHAYTTHTCTHAGRWGASPQASPSAMGVEGAMGSGRSGSRAHHLPGGGSPGVLPGGGGLS